MVAKGGWGICLGVDYGGGRRLGGGGNRVLKSEVRWGKGWTCDFLGRE